MEEYGRIWSNGIFRTDSNHMQAVDVKQRIYLQRPNPHYAEGFSYRKCITISYLLHPPWHAKTAISQEQ